MHEIVAYCDDEKQLPYHDLTEKYAKATYTIGQQEQLIKTLLFELDRLVNKVEQLPHPEQWRSIQREIEGLKEEREQLLIQNSALRVTPWKFQQWLKGSILYDQN